MRVLWTGVEVPVTTGPESDFAFLLLSGALVAITAYVRVDALPRGTSTRRSLLALRLFYVAASLLIFASSTRVLAFLMGLPSVSSHLALFAGMVQLSLGAGLARMGATQRLLACLVRSPRVIEDLTTAVYDAAIAAVPTGEQGPSADLAWRRVSRAIHALAEMVRHDDRVARFADEFHDEYEPLLRRYEGLHQLALSTLELAQVGQELVLAREAVPTGREYLLRALGHEVFGSATDPLERSVKLLEDEFRRSALDLLFDVSRFSARAALDRCWTFPEAHAYLARREFGSLRIPAPYGLPFTLLWVFSVVMALIVGSMWMSGRLEGERKFAYVIAYSLAFTQAVLWAVRHPFSWLTPLPMLGGAAVIVCTFGAILDGWAEVVAGLTTRFAWYGAVLTLGITTQLLVAARLSRETHRSRLMEGLVSSAAMACAGVFVVVILGFTDPGDPKPPERIVPFLSLIGAFAGLFLPWWRWQYERFQSSQRQPQEAHRSAAGAAA